MTMEEVFEIYKAFANKFYILFVKLDIREYTVSYYSLTKVFRNILVSSQDPVYFFENRENAIRELRKFYKGKFYYTNFENCLELRNKKFKNVKKRRVCFF